MKKITSIFSALLYPFLLCSMHTQEHLNIIQKSFLQNPDQCISAKDTNFPREISAGIREFWSVVENGKRSTWFFCINDTWYTIFSTKNRLLPIDLYRKFFQSVSEIEKRIFLYSIVNGYILLSHGSWKPFSEKNES